VDFAFIVGETIRKYTLYNIKYLNRILRYINLVFMLEAFGGRWAFPIPRIKEEYGLPQGTCKLTAVYLGVPTTVAVFTWAISLLLFLSTIMRISQTLASNGRSLWTRYDIAGLELKPKYETRPNGFQVLVGVRLWKPHFK
jgi:hypothetical protein